jgi:hypothetical protein
MLLIELLVAEIWSVEERPATGRKRHRRPLGREELYPDTGSSRQVTLRGFSLASEAPMEFNLPACALC